MTSFHVRMNAFTSGIHLSESFLAGADLKTKNNKVEHELLFAARKIHDAVVAAGTFKARLNHKMTDLRKPFTIHTKRQVYLDFMKSQLESEARAQYWDKSKLQALSAELKAKKKKYKEQIKETSDLPFFNFFLHKENLAQFRQLRRLVKSKIRKIPVQTE